MRKLMICYFVLFIFLLFIAILPIGCAQGDYANSNPTDRRDNVNVSPVPSANSELVKSETIYFKIFATKETQRLSESEYNLQDIDDNNEVIKVIIDYYSDRTYRIHAEWLCQPAYSQILNIRLGNIQTDIYNGYILCDRSCEGISNISDLNHTYQIKHYYHFNESESSNSLVNTECGGSNILFHIDLLHGRFCPYYTEPAISSGCFEKHTVWWKTVLFNCSGLLLDANQNIEIDISI